MSTLPQANDNLNETNSEDSQRCEAESGCDERASYRVTVRSVDGGRRVTRRFCVNHYEAVLSDLQRYNKETGCRRPWIWLLLRKSYPWRNWSSRGELARMRCRAGTLR
jgi:hypothetical protein